MLKRQRVLLRLLDRAGGTAPREWLVRMAFLVSRDRAGWASSPLYDFVPLATGPGSFSLDREAEALERDGHVASAGPLDWTLTASGRAECASIDPAHAAAILGAWHRYDATSGDDLAARIEREFPWYTMNSADRARRRVARPRADRAIHTAGYRGLSIDAFLDGLLVRGIERIVDVRANPASRRLGFHKSTLRRLAAEVGIAYEHLPQLGVDKELRAAASTTGEVNRMFEDYAVRVRALVADLDAVVALLEERPSVLVCAEMDAADCHRSRLATALAERCGLAIAHLDLRLPAGAGAS